MSSVLLATCRALPTGGEESLLTDLLAQFGVDAAWASWDDPEVDWRGADLVAVRTTWDYIDRLEEFVGWTGRVAARTRLVNPADVIAWNTDKRYLVELPAMGLPVVPTEVAAEHEQLAELLRGRGSAVVKPAVGASGLGLTVWRPGDAVPQVPAPVVVQPVVQSVRTRGEVSVFVLGGSAVSQVGKRPGAGEVRVHEEYGGASVLEPLDDEAAALAVRAMAAVGERFGAELPYGRVDLLQLAGGWVVGELELTEPSLYLHVAPSNAPAYVEALVKLLG